MKNKIYFNHFQLKLLLLLTILVNLSGLLHPIIRNDDPLLYANIAKNMVLSGDWLNLMFNQVDWLDKPHLPFWLTALSFKIFGINSFAYMLPGFLFNLLGAYYTYRLGCELYESTDVGLIAAILYLTSLHLLISAIDVRAEAYLMGTIMGACYYWYKYNESDNISLKWLVLGAVFTALSLMTKGLFVLLTIMSGLIFVWAYTGKLANLVKLKWLLGLGLCLLFTGPEIYALYMQFDAHPEKLVFARHHVSGIKWFFWDSQFGRFFNFGPIKVNHNQAMHYIYFVHTFMWAFLPWSIMFVYVVYRNIKTLLIKDTILLKDKTRIWYLFGSFIPTFILFSATSFQLDHYTNIIMPFAAILCAGWLYNFRVEYKDRSHPIFHFQIWFAYLLTFVVVVSSVLIFGHTWLLVIGAVALLMLILFIFFTHKDDLTKSFLYPALAINLTFIFMMQVNEIAARYDLGYQAASYINKLPQHPVIDYNVDSLTLEFHIKTNYQREKTPLELANTPKPYYLVIKTTDLANSGLGSLQILTHIPATTIDKVMANLFTRPRLNDSLVDYSIVLVK